MNPHRFGSVCALLGVLTACYGSESPGSKSEYALLQGVESEARETPISGPEIKTVDGYELLALPATEMRSPPNTTGRIWIMLNPKHAPYWKQMPSAGVYSVPQSLLDDLVREKRVSTAVQNVLRAHVAAGA
jgi:hypothetical protein